MVVLITDYVMKYTKDLFADWQLAVNSKKSFPIKGLDQ